LSSQPDPINGIVSLLKATMFDPSTRPSGGGGVVGTADGLTVGNGSPFAEGNETGVTASALSQIQFTLTPVTTNAPTTNAATPTNRPFRPPPPPRTPSTIP
jgi:hypothetical protein